MSERDLLRVMMENAELTRYEHGGARLAVTAKGAKRELIADFYGNGEWREFFMDLVQAEAKRRASAETSAAQPFTPQPVKTWEPDDNGLCKHCGLTWMLHIAQDERGRTNVCAPISSPANRRDEL